MSISYSLHRSSAEDLDFLARIRMWLLFPTTSNLETLDGVLIEAQLCRIAGDL